MPTDHMQLTQLAIELDTIPVTFRCVFVIFLFAIVFLVKDDDKKGIKKIND